MKKKHAIHFDNPTVVRLNPARRAFIFLVVVCLIFIGPVFSYYATTIFLGKENGQMNEQLSQQSILIEELSEQVNALKQINENTNLSTEVDRYSIENMRQEVIISQKQIEFLNEQILFYQSLMDPDPEKRGIYLEQAELNPLEEGVDGRYQYNLIIAQRSSDHQKIMGSVEVEFISDKNGETPQVLALSSLTEDRNPLPLGFKFFQTIDGDVTLPDGFSPSKYRVLVSLRGQSVPSLDETYVWNP